MIILFDAGIILFVYLFVAIFFASGTYQLEKLATDNFYIVIIASLIIALITAAYLSISTYNSNKKKFGFEDKIRVKTIFFTFIISLISITPIIFYIHEGLVRFANGKDHGFDLLINLGAFVLFIAYFILKCVVYIAVQCVINEMIIGGSSKDFDFADVKIGVVISIVLIALSWGMNFLIFYVFK